MWWTPTTNWPRKRYRGDESIFNIGSGCGTSLNDLVSILSQVLRRDRHVDHMPARDFHVKSNVLCCSKVLNVFGCSVKMLIDDGLRKTVKLLKANTLLA